MNQSMIEALLDGPAMAPPPGVKANFVNPDNLSHPELAWLQLSISTAVVVMRVYTKLGVVRKMLAEDYWLIIAWVCFACFHVIVFMSETLPLGVHQWDLTARKAMVHARLFHISVAIYALVITPLKVAIILQIRRIFMPHRHSLHTRSILVWIIDGFLLLNVLFYFALFLFVFLACRPLEHAWNPLVAGTCVKDKMVLHIVSASINTVSDLIIVIFPQPVIWRLELTMRRKWGLSAVFLLGGLACVASAIRLYYSVLLYYSIDQTYRAAVMGKWAEPEITFGFLAACLPVLPAFIKHIVHTPLGIRMCGLWTLSSATGGKSTGPYDLGEGRQVKTIGSNGRRNEKQSRITKVVEMDIEFEELTRESRDGSTGEGRSSGTSRERDEEWTVGAKGVRQQASVGPLRA